MCHIFLQQTFYLTIDEHTHTHTLLSCLSHPLSLSYTTHIHKLLISLSLNFAHKISWKKEFLASMCKQKCSFASNSNPCDWLRAPTRRKGAKKSCFVFWKLFFVEKNMSNQCTNISTTTRIHWSTRKWFFSLLVEWNENRYFLHWKK